MSKKDLSEADICDRFITPAVEKAGWDKTTQVRREFFFTAGQVVVRGKVSVRGKRKFADNLLFYQPNLPIAIIEAKDNPHPVGGGMQQALAYAEALDVPFVFSSNGDVPRRLGRTGPEPECRRQRYAAGDSQAPRCRHATRPKCENGQRESSQGSWGATHIHGPA